MDRRCSDGPCKVVENRGALVGFGTQLRSLSRYGLETGLDAGDRAARMTRLALQEVKTRVLLQDRVGRATRVACHVLLWNNKTQVVNIRKVGGVYMTGRFIKHKCLMMSTKKHFQCHFKASFNILND